MLVHSRASALIMELIAERSFNNSPIFPIWEGGPAQMNAGISMKQQSKSVAGNAGFGGQQKT
ncbi:MAG: hypothetical protein KDJ90_08980 [Nitratireductor sp.]|nr:hypothetical protein [Nitratireductor sp.]